MRFGGGSTACGTGSGNCINGASSGGSCNNNRNGSEVTFAAVDVSCFQNVQLLVSHRTHQLCNGQGQGLDSGDNLNFEISIDGGPFNNQGTISGAGNCGWNYTNVGCSGNVSNPFSFSVPAGSQTVALRVRLNYNRADEVIYLDDVTLTGDGASATVEITTQDPTSICSGENVTLESNSGGPFQWNFEDEPIESANQSTYDANTPGSYTLTIGSGSCAVTSDPIEITLVTLPPVEINHNGQLTICEGEDVLLEASVVGTSYQWNKNHTPIVDATESTYSANEPGEYTLSLSQGNCSTHSDTIEVVVNETPVVSITPEGIISLCEGEEIILEVIFSGTLQWIRNDEQLEGATQSTLTVTSQGDYHVEVTDGICIGRSDTVTVNVLEDINPVVALEGSPSLCEGESVQLSVEQGFNTYQWYLGTSPIVGATNAQHQATESGNYSVEVSTGTCSGVSNIVQITVVDMVVPELNSVNADCIGAEINLSVPNIYDSYQWLQADNEISGAVNFTHTLILSETTELSVLVSIGNCSVTSNEITIEAIQLPSVSLNLNNDTVVCGNSFTLVGTSSINTYQWLQSGNPILGATNNTFIVTEDGDYSLVSSWPNSNCSATSNQFAVILWAAEEVEIQSSSLTACIGQSISLSVSGNYDSILWSNNANANNIDVVASGTYSVIVSSDGCTSQDEIQITFYPTPTVNAGVDTVSDCNTGVLLTGIGSGTLTWESDPTLTVYENSATALANPTSTTYYTLTSTIGTCVATDIVMVEVDCNSVYIPNIFTPNGDGVNDFFEVKVRGASTFHLQIFNRWGEMLFESTDPKKVWSGGKQDYYAPDGVYFWTLYLLDANNSPMLDKSKTHGTVTIARQSSVKIAKEKTLTGWRAFQNSGWCNNQCK